LAGVIEFVAALPEVDASQIELINNPWRPGEGNASVDAEACPTVTTSFG
jgi:hypothetical protein